MATRYAVASGNWSDTATWDGGTLPGAGDTVYPNGFDVVIDQDIEVYKLRLNAETSPTIAANGTFTWAKATAGVITITGGIEYTDYATTSSTACFVTVSGSAGDLTINANIFGQIIGTYTPYRAGGFRFDAAYGGEIVVNGDCGGNYNRGPLEFFGTNTNPAIGLTINGNCYGGTANSSYAITLQGTFSHLTITGDVVGGFYSNAWCIRTLAQTYGNPVITVNGNVTGGLSSGAYGMNLVGVSTLDIVGDVIATAAQALYLGNSSIIATITGDVVASADTYAIYHASGVLTVTGDLYAKDTRNAINQSVSSSTRLYVDGNLYSSGTYGDITTTPGTHPVSGAWSSKGNATLYVLDFPNAPDTGTSTVYAMTTKGANNADPADVREGVIYGEGGTLTGTLAVPPAASVAIGVPVDDTVGTGAVLLSDIAAVTGAQIAAATGS